MINLDAPLSHTEYATRAMWVLAGVKHQGGTITHSDLSKIIGASGWFPVNHRDWGQILDLVAMADPDLHALVVRKDGKVPAGAPISSVDTIAVRHGGGQRADESAQLKRATDAVNTAVQAHEVSMVILAGAISAQLNAGMTTAQVADQSALSQMTVASLASKAIGTADDEDLRTAADTFKATARTVEASKDTRAELLTRLKEEGWPINDLARQSGCSRLTVEKALSRMAKVSA